jgi:hypothetical protein
MRHALAERDTVGAAREHNPAAAALHQLRLATQHQAERQQAALQTLAAVDPHQADALTDQQLADGDWLGQCSAFNENYLRKG